MERFEVRVIDGVEHTYDTQTGSMVNLATGEVVRPVSTPRGRKMVKVSTCELCVEPAEGKYCPEHQVDVANISDRFRLNAARFREDHARKLNAAMKDFAEMHARAIEELKNDE